MAIAIDWSADAITNYVIEGLIGTLVAADLLVEAATWHGAYEATCARSGFRGTDHEEASLAEMLSNIRGDLDSDVFASAVDRGSTTSVDDLAQTLSRQGAARLH